MDKMTIDLQKKQSFVCFIFSQLFHVSKMKKSLHKKEQCVAYGFKNMLPDIQNYWT